MRAPVRTRRYAPKRNAGPVRPACIARRHANRYVENKTAAAWVEGLRKGLAAGREHRVTDALGRWLGGDQDLDLMTSDELRDLALLLVRMASEVTRRRFAVPVEPYVAQPWYAQDDGDIDIPLDDEDQS